ncbi:uncharacterized protein C1orf21 homolog [Haliotis cracherodii]|uniref:uncharacterized protein C1orf21 homolog n=1 Tax=Haliotis cracherodii TaxID=6455 RepID=UPI0039E74772
MWLLPEPTMGCGRSKHSSKNSSDDSADREVKQAQKLLAKTDKSNKIGDKKENEDPIRTNTVKNGGSKRERAARKQEEKLTLSPLKSANTNFVNNGTVNVSNTRDVQDSHKSDKFLESRTRTSFKDRPAPGNPQNVQNLTTSQIEFFKMLDEKIEQGRDYYVEESSED